MVELFGHEIFFEFSTNFRKVRALEFCFSKNIIPLGVVYMREGGFYSQLALKFS